MALSAEERSKLIREAAMAAPFSREEPAKAPAKSVMEAFTAPAAPAKQGEQLNCKLAVQLYR